MIKQSPLWHIELPDSTRGHYVFGTMHLRNAEAFAHYDLVKPYIERVATYAAEMDLQIDDAKQLKYLTLPEGQLLSTLVGKRKYKRYSAICQDSFGIELDTVQHFSPFYLTQYFSEMVQPAVFPKALDYALWEYALQVDKVTIGVETFEEQINIMQSIPLHLSMKSLDQMFRNTSNFKKSIARISTLYASGDIKGIHRNARKQLGALRPLLMYDRNRIMADRIDHIVQSSSTFVAVGAAHLWGDQGILALLKRKGYKVKPF